VVEVIRVEREGLTPWGRDFIDRTWRPYDLLDWSLWGGWPRMRRGWGEPTVDMHETEDEVIVEADVPGYDPKNLWARVSPDSLTIRGTLERKTEEDKDGYYLRERQSGRFQRTIRFPTAVHADKAVAKYKDGVLRITAPKVMKTSDGARDLTIERE
jgi:HSP20 family protein